MLYGGPGGIRTPVQDSFALKGLQLFFKSCHATTFLIRDLQ